MWWLTQSHSQKYLSLPFPVKVTLQNKLRFSCLNLQEHQSSWSQAIAYFSWSVSPNFISHNRIKVIGPAWRGRLMQVAFSELCLKWKEEDSKVIINSWCMCKVCTNPNSQREGSMVPCWKSAKDGYMPV